MNLENLYINVTYILYVINIIYYFFNCELRRFWRMGNEAKSRGVKALHDSRTYAKWNRDPVDK